MCRRDEGDLLKLEASVRLVRKRDQVILNVVNVVVGAGQAASQIQNRRKCPIDVGGLRSDWLETSGSQMSPQDSICIECESVEHGG